MLWENGDENLNKFDQILIDFTVKEQFNSKFGNLDINSNQIQINVIQDWI